METGESTPLLLHAENLRQKNESEELSVRTFALSMASEFMSDYECRLLGLDGEKDKPSPLEAQTLNQYLFNDSGPLSGPQPKWNGLDMTELARATAAVLWLLIQTRPPSKKLSMKQTAVRRTQEEKMRRDLRLRLTEAFGKMSQLAVRWEEFHSDGATSEEDTDVLVVLLLKRLRLDDSGLTTSGMLPPPQASPLFTNMSKLFTSVFSNAVADLLLQTPLLPKSSALRAVTCDPGWNAAVENVWRQHVPIGRRKGFTAE